tara:strand:- start:140 stop:370 length:231 start_codon:yes stop_codon:yes gene_type:complete
MKKKIQNYWEDYYSKDISPQYPSNFAKFCSKKIPLNKVKILEIGCGNGRDSVFFSKKNNVVATDFSHNSIKILKKK